MSQKAQERRLFFEVGHKVQLKPSWSLLGSNSLEGVHATIVRIQLYPDPNIFQDPEDWHRGPHWVRFWVKLDDFPGLDEHVKHMETPFGYYDLRPLPPRMTAQQLTAYCEQRLRAEQDSDRWNAYFQVKRYLSGESLSYPLSFALTLPPGRCVDLINLFVSWAAWMRQKAQAIREANHVTTLADTYEAQAQVYDELYQRLLPKKHVLANLA